jgi:2-keto-4-pentenoate hydratase
MIRALPPLLLLLLLSAAPAGATECPQYGDRVKTIAEHYLQKRAIADLRAIPDMAAARCIADWLAQVFEQQAGWGAPVGYKVGLTSKTMQERLGLDAPVWGRLTAAMLLPEGQPVPANYGARPVAEADLLVRIADAGIMEATTPGEAALHVSEVIAFIELADLVFDPETPVTAERVVAINVGARLGVVGESRPMTPELAAALPAMEVSLAINGATQFAAPGSALLGHPLEPLVWLAAALQAEGRALEAGDLVSLGSFGPPSVPQAGQEVTVIYDGLPGGPLLVSVLFAAPE